MELSDYVRILRRNWALITAATLLVGLAALILSLTTAPTYAAQTKLFVATQSSGSIADLQQGNTFTQARVQSYAETATTPSVLQPVVDSLALGITAAELSENVEAIADPTTVLLTINASSESPVEAAAIAQAVAESLVNTVRDLESTNEAAASPVKLSVVTPATAPQSPAAPNIAVNTVLGLIVGLLVGLGTAIVRSMTDTRVRSEGDIRRISDIPVLGGITFDKDAAKKPLLTQVPTQSPRSESFRQIRTNLQFAHVGRASKAILVTSSLPGEGKSTTATNLALALAQGGQSVVLIDADLRRPRVDQYLGLERDAGLTTALIGRAKVEDLLQPWGSDELYVLTSGQIPPNPSELLGSEAMKTLISELEDSYDAVIIDAPPLLPVTDAAVLARQVGGVVLVVGSSKVKLPDLEKSLSNLEMVDADILGVVINLLPVKGPDAYSYTYYTYDTLDQQSDSHAVKGSAQSGSRAPSAIDSFDEAVLGLRREPAARRSSDS